MNKLPLLREGKLLKFLARLPIVGPLKMGSMMLFKPRSRGWARTGAVLAAYVEEQKRLMKARES